MFVIICAPIAMLEVEVEGITRNLDTGKLSSDYMLPCSTLDCASGKGSVNVLDRNQWDHTLSGFPVLQALYDFTRKLGARDLVVSFLNEKVGYVDKAVAEMEPK